MSKELEYKMPSNAAELAAFQRIDAFVKPHDMTETQRFYDAWASKYDEDLDVIEFKGIAQAAATLSNIISKEEQNREDFYILDLASGTGKCGALLKERGFRCTIDALEANEAMNDIASKKGIYRDLKVHVVTPSTRIPFNDEVYDVIVCTGGFSRTHIQAECIKDVVRVLKPGGFFWFCVRNTKQAAKFNQEVEAVLSQLTESGTIEVILRQDFDYYSFKVEDQGSTDDSIVPGLERCVRKCAIK